VPLTPYNWSTAAPGSPPPAIGQAGSPSAQAGGSFGSSPANVPPQPSGNQVSGGAASAPAPRTTPPSGGDANPVVPLTPFNWSTAVVDLRQGPVAPPPEGFNDTSVVDLRDAKSLTVDPGKPNGNAPSANGSNSSPRTARTPAGGIDVPTPPVSNCVWPDGGVSSCADTMTKLEHTAKNWMWDAKIWLDDPSHQRDLEGLVDIIQAPFMVVDAMGAPPSMGLEALEAFDWSVGRGAIQRGFDVARSLPLTPFKWPESAGAAGEKDILIKGTEKAEHAFFGASNSLPPFRAPDSIPWNTRGHLLDQRALAEADREIAWRKVLKDVNPTRWHDGLPFTDKFNCVPSVIATIAVLRGNPETAPDSYSLDCISKGGVSPTRLEGVFVRKPLSSIELYLLERGPGSIGVVGMRYPSEIEEQFHVPGHVFLAVNDKGVVRYIDTQQPRDWFSGEAKVLFNPRELADFNILQFRFMPLPKVDLP
jgi:hypothetical protein